MTIDAAKTTAVGGWVRPNDHVDVIGIFKDPQTNESVAVTLMENVMVLATNNNGNIYRLFDRAGFGQAMPAGTAFEAVALSGARAIWRTCSTSSTTSAVRT